MVLVLHVEGNAINALVILKCVYHVKMAINTIQIKRHAHNLVNPHKYHILIQIPHTKYVLDAIHHVNSVHHIHKTV